ncbi:acetate--CoA ligase family protein [Glacieibacterium megasporae]|uniref:acetate--CoA ligase family protein n=1 Tax=Glacieibacterium megasporae TaxID=2835787 RepID=UPI001C1E44B0|nr:acetate--CoA ligase family protein [Polymorphobacter megasporae]UAJ12593.1 acetate--CoA ligase family protein [Polymorphobacter megasporae]
MPEAPTANVSFAAVGRLLRPKSVAIVGVSEDGGSMGGRSFRNIKAFDFPGAVHLVSRTNASVGGRPCVATIDDLPDEVDAAVIALPARAIVPAIEACARKGIGGAVVFAAGFAEAGAEGVAAQARMTAIAREADIAVLGPNTLGMTNFVAGNCLAFGPNAPSPPEGRPALAVLAQSGAMMGSLRLSATVRNYAVSYAIATGNEAVTGVEDFMAHIVDDADTHAIAVFAEQLRRPLDFLALARRARGNGKPVILLHPGRSDRARDSAASHTGALSGNYDVMRALVASEAVILVETLEELLDAAEFFTRFPVGQATGPSVITDSGALRGLSLDFADSLGLTLPDLNAGTLARLRERLPTFAEASNPLDITAQGLKDMPLYAEATAAMAADPGSSGVLVAVMPGSPEVGMIKAQAILPALIASDKPKAYVVLGDAPVDPTLAATMQTNGIPFYRSPERALRMFAHSARFADLKQRANAATAAPIAAADRVAGSGAMLEHAGKALLQTAAVAVPEGALATTLEGAVVAATRIGYPVVLKVQSAQLLHKTEVGGVAVGLADEAALRAAWGTMAQRVTDARPDAVIAGYLVEAMAARGLELVVGGRRDPNWGPVVVVGLGGVWIEALNDIRLLPASVTEAVVIEELGLLKAHSLLEGARGAAPVDKAAVARVVTTIGQLLLAHPEIVEIDINPLVVFADRPPVALDALIVLG